MIKIVAVITKKPEHSREEFLRHWHEDHPAYVRRLPGIRRYRQNPAIDHRTDWPFDGMAELWFDSVAAVKEAYAGEDGKALFAHEELFLADMQWFISEEKEIQL
ncbi:EthD family reductase [Corynebacterium sp.]|uniref:EthD family reductase n=1 Tax=Corynebacterium sp. TaxID=1720 RepID=UPI0026E0F99F|nr:EthD family reductase [Corynebacterium sp.]MDO5511746.1 EthD family reductase [Corynebacterium sp.]